jgi:hypothetical protein
MNPKETFWCAFCTDEHTTTPELFVAHSRATIAGGR